MAGFAGSITPANTGGVQFTVTGSVNNTAAGGCFIELNYGTGTAPAAGVAQTGTIISSAPEMLNPAAAGATGIYSFTVQGVVTGLTLSTAYWYEVSFRNQVGGICGLSQETLTALEQYGVYAAALGKLIQDIYDRLAQEPYASAAL